MAQIHQAAPSPEPPLHHAPEASAHRPADDTAPPRAAAKKRSRGAADGAPRADAYEATQAASHWQRLGHYVSLHSADGLRLAIQHASRDPQKRGLAHAQVAYAAWCRRGADPEGFEAQHDRVLNDISVELRRVGLDRAQIAGDEQFGWSPPQEADSRG